MAPRYTHDFGPAAVTDVTPTAGGKRADLPVDIRSQGKVLDDWGLHLVDLNLVMGNLQSLIRQQAAACAH